MCSSLADQALIKCQGCHRISHTSQTALHHHMDVCQPWCSSCYKAHIVKEGYRHWTSRLGPSPFCDCAPTSDPNIFQRVVLGSKKKWPTANQKDARRVCQECSILSDNELLAAREKRTKLELMQGRKSDGTYWTTCAARNCGKMLGSGPRWWICSRYNCVKECRSSLHSAWGRSDRAVGSDAV